MATTAIPLPVSFELELLRAKLRHGLSVSCDRCQDTLTLSSMTMAVLEPHLLRTIIELKWTVSHATAEALGAVVAPVNPQDLCPPCTRLVNSVPQTSR